MVIEHDHIEAKLARDLERLAADGAAVDGHHERRASRGEILNRLDIGAVALGHAIGDMDDRLQPAGVQIFAEQRRAARAVDVVVAEDRHLLMGQDRAPEALGRRRHIAQAKGVRHEIAEAWREMAVDRLRQRRRARQARGRSARHARRFGQWRARAIPLPRQAAAATAGRAPRSQRRGSNRRASKLRLWIRQRGSLRITCRRANHDRTRLDPEGFRARPSVRRPQSFLAQSAGTRRSWTGASGGWQLDWRDRANDVEPQRATTKSPSRFAWRGKSVAFSVEPSVVALDRADRGCSDRLGDDRAGPDPPLGRRRDIGQEQRDRRFQIRDCRRHLCRSSGLLGHRRVGKVQRRADFRRRGSGRDRCALSLCRRQGTRGGRPANGARQLPQGGDRRGMARDGPRIRGSRGHAGSQPALLGGAGAQSVRNQRHGGHVGGLPADRQRDGGPARSGFISQPGLCPTSSGSRFSQARC